MHEDDTSLRIKPRQKRAVEKVERILQATALLLEHHGVDELNILAIAREAQLPPATIYHYFENRTAIFMALAERTMREVDEAFAHVLLAAGEQSNPPDWQGMVRQLYEAYKSAPGYRQVLPLLRATPGLREIEAASNRRSVEFLRTAFVHLQMSPERVERVALMLAEMVQSFLDMALCAGTEAQAEAYVEEMQIMIGALAEHYLARVSA